MSVFLRLSAGELSNLAVALRSGRLSAPFTEIAVRRYCTSFGGEIAAELADLDSQGLSGVALAKYFDIASATRATTIDDAIDLVWSGPEAPGIANRDTGTVVSELFGSAQFEVIIAGFAIHQGKSIFRRLAERMAEVPGLKVRLYLDVRREYRDTTSSSELAWKFSTHFRTHEWPSPPFPEIYYDPRSLEPDGEKRSSLHAKCVVVDRRLAFVTSANFTEAAQRRNIEVGALVRSPAFAEDLARHFDALREAHLLVGLPGGGGAA